MKLAALLVGFAAACSPTGYYVSGVYQDSGKLYQSKCEIQQGQHADHPDPTSCKLEPIPPVPAEFAAQLRWYQSHEAPQPQASR
ncbi:MAG TPA: hypothetical protein VGM88_32040 [Kofleriaceae bacterium]|jgi:hypothetical protein